MGDLEKDGLMGVDDTPFRAFLPTRVFLCGTLTPTVGRFTVQAGAAVAATVLRSRHLPPGPQSGAESGLRVHTTE
jgi:hypothetical protein